MIEVKSVSKTYGRVKALDEVTFTVEKGEVLGFLGPNGAGKSTTMKILTGIISPDAGEISIGGFDIFTKTLDTQKLIGYLPESNPLYYDMPVAAFVNFAAEARGVPSRERKARVAEIAKRCNIDEVMHKNISELSKGFKQRVGLAQAMISKPEILILDEPTSGLDPKQIIEIRELIKSLGSEKTVILSTHILQEVEATCTRVIIINEGKITASGSPEQLRRTMQGGALVQAAFRGDENSILARLREHPDVASADIVSRTGGLLTCKIAARSSKDIREEIYHIAVKNGFGLVELKGEALRLEDIFLKLTGKQV